MSEAYRMIHPSLEQSLETLLMQETCVELRMLGRPLTEEHGWFAMGYGGCEILEYREAEDSAGLRSIRITRPRGTWTLEYLCWAVGHIENILRGRPTLEEMQRD